MSKKVNEILTLVFIAIILFLIGQVLHAESVKEIQAEFPRPYNLRTAHKYGCDYFVEVIVGTEEVVGWGVKGIVTFYDRKKWRETVKNYQGEKQPNIEVFDLGCNEWKRFLFREYYTVSYAGLREGR